MTFSPKNVSFQQTKRSQNLARDGICKLFLIIVSNELFLFVQKQMAQTNNCIAIFCQVYIQQISMMLFTGIIFHAFSPLPLNRREATVFLSNSVPGEECLLWFVHAALLTDSCLTRHVSILSIICCSLQLRKEELQGLLIFLNFLFLNY